MRPHVCVDASTGNLGQSALGVYIPTNSDNSFFQIIKCSTNNTAEMAACHWGIALMEERGYSDFIVFTDSQFVQQRYKGPYTVIQIPRYMNAVANCLAHSALKHGSYPAKEVRNQFAHWHNERLVMYRSEIHE